MSNFAVVTINIGNTFARMASLTLPYIKSYANKIGADFVEITEPMNIYNEYSAYWAKFQIRDLLDRYDRLILLDLDVFVMPNCKNLFEVVPAEKFGALYETDYGLDFSKEIEQQNTRMPAISWADNEYFNAGVMVVSACHKDVFTLFKGDDGGMKYPEQSLMNYKAKKHNIPTFHLDYRFNHMPYLNVSVDDRAYSGIIHYAAIAHQLRELIIAEDIFRYENNITMTQGDVLRQFSAEFSHLEYHFQFDEMLEIT
ncbi:glycosyltransferase [Pseudoalteromonas rhizosphaerae]|uniref:glycosyltransferase n=1 Tax=Pseudoalteromonas rhizosphaerae TaxID=2518973 RepID=UPI0038506261